MADNVAVTAGTGTTIAADEVIDGTLGTVKVQYVKIMDATIDGTTKAAVGANGLAVSSAQSGTWTVQPGNTANTTPWLAKVSDGTNAAAIKAASTAPVATDPALVVAISPNSVNANGAATSTNSAPVVPATDWVGTTALSKFSTGYYFTQAAGTGPTAIQSSAGAIGDYLAGVLIIPASTSPGAVTITDGNGSAITIFAGGASSLSNLVPFYVPLGAVSRNTLSTGSWKITTGANVSAIAIGKFS